MHRQGNGRATANARCTFQKNRWGHRAPNRFCQGERSVLWHCLLPAMWTECLPYQEQQQSQVSTVSGQRFWCDNHFRNKGKSVYRTRNKVIDCQPVLGIKTKNVNQVRNNKQNCQPKSVHVILSFLDFLFQYFGYISKSEIFLFG